MSEIPSVTYPYSLEVQPVPGGKGQYAWTIRQHGKVFQRSDRRHPSDAKATQDGLSVIERLLTGGGDQF